MTFLCHVKLEGQTSSVASAVVAGPYKSGVLTGYTENPNPSLPRIYVLKADSSCQTPTITLSTPELTPNLFSLYPNPASQVVIRFEEAKKTKLLGVKLLDSSGRQWSPEFENKSAPCTYNQSGRSSGWALLTQITTDDTIFTQTRITDRINRHAKAMYQAGVWALHLDLTQNLKYDRATQKAIRLILNPESNAIDVGAHKGEILRQIALNAPKGQHLAIEPIPSMAERLKTTLMIAIAALNSVQ